MDDQLYDSALGCFLGACIGDTASAILELLGRKPSIIDVDYALNNAGGSVFNLDPGQITYDGD